jgi:hypothetical protein
VLTLAPGKKQLATLTVRGGVPAGQHDLVAEFGAVPGTRAGVVVSGAVGAQMLVQGKGHAATDPCVSLSPPPKPGQSFQWPYVVGIPAGVFVFAGLLLTLLIYRLRRRRLGTGS